MFFSSSNAVVHFFEQIDRLPKVKFAAIGKGTSKTLEKYATPSFIGEGSPNEVAKKFNEKVGDQKVLFPIAEDSLQTVQSYFDKKQIKNLVVYKTLLKEDQYNNQNDVVIFTSPTNVRGFFNCSKLNGNEKIIAIGSSTQKELKKHAIHSIKAFAPDELSLVDEVYF